MDCHSSPIEMLPEDIQLRILLSLPLVDAVASRILSRRWKKLSEKSCSLLSNLCFDLDNIIGVDRPEKKGFTYYRKGVRINDGTYFDISDKIMEDFIQGVDMIVQCCQSKGKQQDPPLGVESLEITFPLWDKHSCLVDNWISSTVTSITKKLVLVFFLNTYPENPSFNMSEYYKFPFEVLVSQKTSSLEHLHLESISVQLPPNFNGFTTLKKLRLICTDLSQEDAHKLLITCPLLEFLHINGFGDNFVALQVSSPLPHLKVLILQNCNELRRIDLRADNLSKFEYDTCLKIDHLKLGGCHNPTKVAVTDIAVKSSDSFHPLSNVFPFATSLYLDLCDFKSLSVVLGGTFAHLKFLAIFLSLPEVEERNLRNLSSMLNVFAPMLEELELHVFCSSALECGNINSQIIEGDSYNYLRRVTFTGFTGGMGQMMLAKYFLTKATRLQAMTLDPVRYIYCKFDKEERSRRRRKINRKCWNAYNLLCEVVPKDVKLTLLGKMDKVDFMM